MNGEKPTCFAAEGGQPDFLSRLAKDPRAPSFRGGRLGDRRGISQGLSFQSEIAGEVYPERENAEILRSAQDDSEEPVLSEAKGSE